MSCVKNSNRNDLSIYCNMISKIQFILPYTHFDEQRFMLRLINKNRKWFSVGTYLELVWMYLCMVLIDYWNKINANHKDKMSFNIKVVLFLCMVLTDRIRSKPGILSKEYQTIYSSKLKLDNYIYITIIIKFFFPF